jgi:hypothetical protein
MRELVQQISALIDASECDRERIERTLTDGYAHALSLEAERFRLEKRLAGLARGLRPGNADGKAGELSRVARRLEGNAGELMRLRVALGGLRDHARTIR